jgi:hypothetical protein
VQAAFGADGSFSAADAAVLRADPPTGIIPASTAAASHGDRFIRRNILCVSLFVPARLGDRTFACRTQFIHRHLRRRGQSPAWRQPSDPTERASLPFRQVVASKALDDEDQGRDRRTRGCPVHPVFGQTRRRMRRGGNDHLAAAPRSGVRASG